MKTKKLLKGALLFALLFAGSVVGISITTEGMPVNAGIEDVPAGVWLMSAGISLAAIILYAFLMREVADSKREQKNAAKRMKNSAINAADHLSKYGRW